MSRARLRRRPWLVTAILAAVPACSVGEGRTVQESPSACEIAYPVSALPAMLGEVSGVARDPRRPDLFWVHNDSGNEPLLFAIDTTGALLSTVRVTEASARDLEDIALGRCGEAWCLYLGDIGDNRAVHPSIRVHRLPLPALPNEASGTGGFYDGIVSPIASWELVYPDGARDAEGLIVDDARGELLVVTKGREGPILLYAASMVDLESAGRRPVTLRRIGRLAIPVSGSTAQLVTAADLSPDGTRLAIRSYIELFLFSWRGAAAQDTAEAPAVASLLTAFEPQGEGLSWRTDGNELFLVSEGRQGRPPQLSRIRCPRP